MVDTGKVTDISLTSSTELTSSLMEQLGKAFVELEAHKVASIDKVHWNDVEQHFRHLESSVKKKLEELEAKEKVFTERESHNRMLLAENEAAVMAKEQDMLDKVQELKDYAVAAIEEARANYKPESLEPAKVSSSIDNENANVDAPEGKSPRKIGESAEGKDVEINPRAELTQYCEQMDSKGLLKFLTENLKNLSDVCKEQLSVVLGSATDPARLVLNALEGFFPPDEQGDNGDAAIYGMRRSCLLLMEALSAFLAKADSSADNFLNPENMHIAMAIAHEWKPKLAGENSQSTDAANGYSLEAEGFLRLLATFRIASEFDGEELCKHVLAVAHHRQAIELCQSLELTQKIPGLVETLISSGRQIDAVHLIHAFQLSETYPTVPLLKAYLKELRRNSQGTGNAAQQNDYNARELAALRAVIECVEEYKLEAAYPLDPLHRRVAQLDKSTKFDKKRSNETLKQSEPKKPRPSVGFSGPRPRGYGGQRQGPSTFSERIPYTRLVDRYSAAIPTPSAYTSYAVSSQSPYASSLASGEGPYYYARSGRPGDPYTAAAAAPAPAPAPTPPPALSYGSYTQSSRYPYL